MTLIHSRKTSLWVRERPHARLGPKPLSAEGNHYTMHIQPNVDGLAQKIAAQAKAAQKEWEQQQISKGFVGPNRLRPAR